MAMRSPSPRVRVGLLFAVLVGGSVSVTEAQQQAALRSGQSPGPRFVVPTLRGDGGSLGFQVARAVRERIASDFDMRALWVLPESTITKYLREAGYPVDQPLTPAETRQLATAFRADEYINGTVSRTPAGAYRVQADWSIGSREDMVQPLPAVEASKIGDVAKLLSQEFQAARRQVESVRRCMDLARARNYTGALAEARKAMGVYPRSVLARVCVANIYDQQKLGPDSMIRISEEILSIHPGNQRALAFAADAYEARGATEDRIRVLRSLFAVDSMNRRVQASLVHALAKTGRAEEARPVIDTSVARNPDDATLLDLQWRIHLAVKDWAGVLAIGESLIAADTAAATPDFFVRMAAAADALDSLPRAVAVVARGVARFPTDDELAVLHIQLLRRGGDLRGALDAANRLVERNPRAPNAWLQKARTEAELGEAADTVIASLRHGAENGENRTLVAGYATTLGQAPLKPGTTPPTTDDLRTGIRYFKFADSVQPSDTTAYIVGATSVSLAGRLYGEARAEKRCDLAREMQEAIVDAQIALPKGGRAFPEPARVSLADLAELMPYADPLVKSVCR